MNESDDVTRPGRGRKPGSKNKAPVISMTDARRALKSVRERARMGSEEDQRALLSYLGSGLFSTCFVPTVYTSHNGTFIEYQPVTGRTSLLDPPPSPLATVHKFPGGDDAA